MKANVSSRKQMKSKRGGGIHGRFNAWDVLMWAFLIIFALITIYPFIYTLAGSFNNAQDFQYGGVWLYPRAPTFASYKVIFADKRLYRALLNTTSITLIGVVTLVLFTSCVAYAMSRRTLRGKRFFWVVNMIPMFIGGGMIPSYMLMLLLGLYDNFFVYIMGVYGIFNMIIFCNYFRSIDDGLYESAKIDGAGEWRIWFTIYMPLSKPVIATVALWTALGRWNSYMATLLYTSKEVRLWTLQFYLMRLIREGALPAIESQYYGEVSAQTLSFAAIVVSSIPIVCLYPFMAKHFSKGIMLGSLKG